MDHHSVHGQDMASFDLPSTHRLPTVSALDALEDLGNDPKRYVATGLENLDRALGPEADGASQGSARPAGFSRGQVIEIWGPPGSGKTTFGLQLASDALKKGGKVIWGFASCKYFSAKCGIDGYRPVCGTRLSSILEDDSASAACGSLEARSLDVMYFTCPTLAHFIALLCRPTASCIPEGTSLLVVDSLSALVNQAFPKVPESRNAPKGVFNTSTRRLQILQSTISSLQKLAATRDLTIVILSHCATRMQAERGATLIPAINTSSWEQGIATRLVLFRDWSFKDDQVSGVRFAGIQRLNGKGYADGAGAIFAFDINDKGLISVAHDGRQLSVLMTSTSHSKRKLGETDFEIANSEEEYGWEDEDSTQLPPNPSQWQGSEDLLVGQHDEDGNRGDEDFDEQSVHGEESGLQLDLHHDLDNANEESD
ncbi:rad55 protein [Seiridium cupressi]